MNEFFDLRLVAHDDTREERRAAHELTSKLFGLAGHISAFAAALSLRRFSRDQSNAINNKLSEIMRARARGGHPPSQSEWDSLNETEKVVREWRNIAARDATMSVYHFGIGLKAIHFKDLPKIREHVDVDLLKKARKTFDTEFPDNIEARNAVGHSAERSVIRERHEKTLYAGGLDSDFIQVPPGVNVSMTNNMIDDRMTSTSKGPHDADVDVISVAINEDTLGKLKAICAQVRQAFLPAATAIEARNVKYAQERFEKRAPSSAHEKEE
jgi:hypothetical protein